MKKIFLMALLVAVTFTFSCRKKNVCTTDIYLTTITEPNGTIMPDRNFRYNQQGRLIEISRTSVGNAITLLNEFSYISDTIFNMPLVASYEQHKVKYLANSQNNFLYRNSVRQYSLTPPEGPQYQLESDSSRYTYDNSGYLIQYDGIQRDSISYYPSQGLFKEQNIIVSYTGFYTIDNGNLKTIRRTLVIKRRSKQAGVITQYTTTAEEITDFFYDKNYPNVFDFKNIFLLKETNTLPFPLYSYNINFRNYPNKAVTTRVEKDLTGGIVSTSVKTEEPSLDFYSSGYIHSFGKTAQANKVFFTYNCPQ